MKINLDQPVLDQLVRDAVAKKEIFGAVFYVSSEDQSVDLISAAGNFNEESQYYIASINKIFVSALILKFSVQNKLDLQDKISKYLPEELVSGLHVYRGKHYSDELRIIHLISQTSGLPCYLIDKQASGIKAMDELEAGIDQAWPIEKVVDEVKKMKPHFPPGEKGKAKYIDTNHQLLSLVIENITGELFAVSLKNLFRDLNMTSTMVCEDAANINFVPVHYKSEIINIPKFLNSTGNDIISTARDQMKFIKAFFNGYFYPKAGLGELEQWNDIFFPFKYGIGIQKFYMPRLLSPFQPVPEMIGHSGSTGAVAFHVPDLDIYISGTVNQQASPNIAFQTMIRIANALRK